MHRVAVVGSGPAGVYATEALVARDDIEVDVYDRLPTPFGLVRYGVAPDHLKIKSIETTLRRILESPRVRFLGNVDIGRDVTPADLRMWYDAVVYAVGAATDRRLDIPGEDLRGSVSATDFVAWYCGHPDAAIREWTLNAREVVVIGVGNVAVDVARILAKTAEDLHHTDVPRRVLDVLAASHVTDISMVGRRGAAYAKFTTKELRELGELTNADVVVDAGELALDDDAQKRYDSDASVRRNVDVLREWSTRPLAGRPRRIHLRFLLRPHQLIGERHVSGVVFERTAASGGGHVRGTGEMVELPAQLVLRSVGYRGVPVAGLPFDDNTGTIGNDEGRVLRNNRPSEGEYVCGWIKRGPTGVIGTNRHDANETVKALLHDFDERPAPSGDLRLDPADVLRERGVDVIAWDGWLAIEQAEIDLGAAQGRAREKLADRDDLLAAARH